MVMIDFKAVAQSMHNHGLYDPKESIEHYTMEDAEDNLRHALASVVGNDYHWSESYDKVADWLADNQCKGLTLMGNCGTGKTLLAKYVLPLIYNAVHQVNIHTFDATELANNPDAIIYATHSWPLVIDDVGCEWETVDYGNRRIAFSELLDNAEKNGRLLILTTNQDRDELLAKYGQRTIDRLESLTIPIVFKGKSLRDKQHK